MTKIAVLFSGGGAQYPGMMKELYDNIPASAEVFRKADRILQKNLSDICFNGTQEELNETSIMIPAIFSADIAAYAAILDGGMQPVATAGYSLGEWAALVAAEVISFEKAMEIVQLRSCAMKEATPAEGAGMAVILGQSKEYVEALCSRVMDSYVSPANYNCPGQITISGTNAALNEIERIAEIEETIYIRLPVDVPSHCALMKPAMEKLATELKDVEFSKPKFPIYSNVTAEATVDPKIIKENIIIQLLNPVKFEQTVNNMFAEGIDTFIEVGPGDTLTKFVKEIAHKAKASVKAFNIENMETLTTALKRGLE